LAITVAVTGASGGIYGLRLVEELLKRGDDVSLIISPSGFIILEEELGLRLEGDVLKGLKGYLKVKKGLRYIPSDDLRSHLSSGSSLHRTLVICPCSMGTLARIAHGISTNLIERTADVILKEKGRLLLVPRETPLNQIHLENMFKLCQIGAHIIPAMPGFYHRPKKVEDMVDFIVGKVLDVLGIEHELYRRWGKGKS